MKDKSPTIPPSTKASATPKKATIAHIPIKGPIPPLPDVAKSNCQKSDGKIEVILNQRMENQRSKFCYMEN